MAFQHTLSREHNKFGADFTNAYTLVSGVSITPRPMLTAPAEEGGEPTVVAKHTLEFDTATYADQATRDADGSPLALHHYTVPYVIPSSEDNVIAFCYTWLIANVAMFDGATNI